MLNPIKLSDLTICIPSGDMDLTPIRVNNTDAGLDIKANEYKVVIKPGTRHLIKTGIQLNLPKNTYGQIAPRSGLSCKGIDVGAGIIDEGYTGEIKVLLINNGTEDFHVTRYMKIAQLLILPILNDLNMSTHIFYKNCDIHLNKSDRGASGFGSSGV